VVVIVLANADGAERQWNCTLRSRSRSVATGRPRRLNRSAGAKPFFVPKYSHNLIEHGLRKLISL
jgi:hypothetical protein